MKKLSTKTVMDLSDALAALDGRPRIVKDGEHETIVQEPYSFAPGLRLALAKNRARCEVVISAYKRFREGMILNLSGGKREIDAKKSPAMASAADQFNRLNVLLLSELHEVDLISVKDDELKLGSEKGQNPIPVTVLAVLWPILDGDSWKLPEPPQFETAMPPLVVEPSTQDETAV